MNFDLTTYCLEIINFLVLIWLVRHFFYKPVFNVITRRKESIDKQLNEAESKLKEAKELQVEYEMRLETWGREKDQLRSEFSLEMQNQRESQLQGITEEAERKRKHSIELFERQKRDESRKLERAALELASQFVERLFAQLASPQLEKSIREIFIHDLDTKTLSAEELFNLNQKESVEILTVFPLSSDERHHLETSLERLLNSHRCTFEFKQDPQLIAGIKVVLGGTVLQCNLRDALTFFRGIEGK